MSDDTSTVKNKDDEGGKQKKRNRILVGIVVAIVILIWGINSFTSNSLYNGKIANNIFIEDVDISNLTKKQALEAVNKKYHPKDLELSYNSKKYMIKPDDIELKYNTEEVIDKAYNLTRSGSYFNDIKSYIDIKSSGKHLAIKPSYDDKKLDKSIEQISDDVHVKYVNAKVLFSSGLSVKPSKKGLKCDDEYNKKQIEKAYKDKSFKEIQLKVDETEPRIKEEDLEGIDTKLASFSTQYSPYLTQRSYNIYLAAKRCNGTVLMPGDTFSYNEETGERLLSNGYKNAPVIVSGTLVDAPGGGVCQGSTTIFNAALLAGLKITDVQNHSLTSHYVSRGRDAMVNDSSSDLKFKNNFDHPVVVYASAGGGIMEAAIYGYKEDKVKVSLNVDSFYYSGCPVAKTYRKVTKDGKTKSECIYTAVYRS